MARRTRQRPLRGSTRRESDWFAVNPSQSTVTAGGGTLIGSLNAAALALRPFTIVRTYLEVLISSDQQIATELYGVGISAAVVSDQALAIGVTAVPTPISDLDSDMFFLHRVMWGAFMFGSAVGIAREGFPYSIDSKAMRKVNGDQDVAVVVESMASTVGEGSTVTVAGRMLIKTH